MNTNSMDIKTYNLLGLAGIDDAPTDNPQDSANALVNWNTYAVRDFGKHAASLGYIPDGSHIMMDMSGDDAWDSSGNVRTKMMELSPQDYQYIAKNGSPYHGMMGLSDDGEVYQYDGLGGFFKRLFKKIRKGVKKVAKKIRKGVRKLLKKTKIGRIFLKIHDKVMSIAMKIVRPLAKIVGKFAAKLAPIAAFIPGYGPAIAGALLAAGKISKMITRAGGVMAEITGPDGKKQNKLVFKDKNKEDAFRATLKRAAARMQKNDPQKVRALAESLKNRDPEKLTRPAVKDWESLHAKFRGRRIARRPVRA